MLLSQKNQREICIFYFTDKKGKNDGKKNRAQNKGGGSNKNAIDKARKNFNNKRPLRFG